MAGPSMTQRWKLASATGARAAAKRPKPATESPHVSEVTKSPRKNQLFNFNNFPPFVDDDPPINDEPEPQPYVETLPGAGGMSVAAKVSNGRTP